eukprot:TRINITY_DN3225_c1_g1_i2.p4 TRINITY_DN3225_c1_g1~~TRINITY_DN3225_c1_g1_i2.p4  ORF type:complete len:119 (-),score=1.66 TRINITY_DN3225_c1_g1_i2:556-912(-)
MILSRKHLKNRTDNQLSKFETKAFFFFFFFPFFTFITLIENFTGPWQWIFVHNISYDSNPNQFPPIHAFPLPLKFIIVSLHFIICIKIIGEHINYQKENYTNLSIQKKFVLKVLFIKF